jgi:hypothetical protein
MLYRVRTKSAKFHVETYEIIGGDVVKRSRFGTTRAACSEFQPFGSGGWRENEKEQ